MELRRLECEDAGSVGGAASPRGSISVTEKERLREGERKALGDSEGCLCVGDGYEAIGGRRFSSLRDSRF